MCCHLYDISLKRRILAVFRVPAFLGEKINAAVAARGSIDFKISIIFPQERRHGGTFTI